LEERFVSGRDEPARVGPQELLRISLAGVDADRAAGRKDDGLESGGRRSQQEAAEERGRTSKHHGGSFYTRGATRRRMRVQIGIVGAGPAGLLLSHLLQLAGIESIVLERQSRRYCEDRVRAGVIEQGTRDVLIESGLGERLQREGLFHEGVALRFEGRSHRIDFAGLTGGKGVTVYGQQEIVKDMIAARLAAGSRLEFDIADVTIHDVE